MLWLSLPHCMDSWLFFTLYSCSSSSLHAEKIALLCLDSYSSLHAEREDCTASMLGFLLFFAAYTAVSFVVELHCCAWILALFLCMQRKNCTAILGFLFYFKMLTKPCHLLERKQCRSLHSWQVQFWEQGSKLLHALFLWFSSIASSSAWSTYNSQTVVWSPAVLKSLFCLFLAWEFFNVISAAGEQQKLIIASLKFESIKEDGIKISTKKGNCGQQSTHAE